MIWDVKDYWEEEDNLILVLESMSRRSLVDVGAGIGVVVLNSTYYHKSLVLD